MYLVGLLLALVDPLEVFNQLQGDPFASDADNVGWLHAGQQSTGLGGREVPFGAAGDQLQQQLVQLAHLHGVFLTDPAATIHQQPQDLDLLVGHDRPQAGHPDPDQGDRVGVGVVGLAALPGGVEPEPCRQLRRHVQHRLGVGDQPLGDVPADPFAALHRPHPLGPLPAVVPHRGVAVGVGGELASTNDDLVGGHHLDGGRPLVRIHPDHDPWHVLTHDVPPSPCPMRFRAWEGTASTSRAFPS